MNEIVERYEFKYLVTADQIDAIRAYARTTSRIDRYAGPDGTYRIRSLYLDNDAFDLYQANQLEQGDRFKMRIRCYPGKTSPVFFEVKRRRKDVIIKSRAAVSEALWRGVVACDGATLDGLAAPVQKNVAPFLARMLRHHIRPVLLVDYEREAYVSDVDGYARLTFDRTIMVQRRDTFDLDADDRLFRLIDHPAQTRTDEPISVLELKFERRPPLWMESMVRHLGLVRRSFSKYCYGVDAAWRLPGQRTAAT